MHLDACRKQHHGAPPSSRVTRRRTISGSVSRSKRTRRPPINSTSIPGADRSTITGAATATDAGPAGGSVPSTKVTGRKVGPGVSGSNSTDAYSQCENPCLSNYLPCSADKFSLFRCHGNSQKVRAISDGYAQWSTFMRSIFERFPCKFPDKQGIHRGERFAVDCVHHQPSLRSSGGCRAEARQREGGRVWDRAATARQASEALGQRSLNSGITSIWVISIAT